MAFLLVNMSRVPQVVGVIGPNRTREYVRLFSRGHLPDGYTVDSRWLAANRGAIRIIDETPPVDTTSPVAAAQSVEIAAENTQTEGDKE
jgi:hypothetical protein